MKNPLKNIKFGKKDSNPQPRELAEIQKDYNQTALAAGQAAYQVFVYQREQAQLNERLLALNREGAERQRLDAEAKKAADAAAKETK